MNLAKNNLTPGWLLIYLGLLALFFVLGAGFGLGISNRLGTPPNQSTPVFVTVTPGSTQAAILPGTTPCGSPPTGWSLYLIQPGDTLIDLAARFQVSTTRIMQANCLASENIIEGQTLYLPALPTPTPCLISPPGGWELYTVQSGDTLFGLAAARGVTTAEVMRVNCLLSENIGVGDALYLPALPTPTPTQTPPPTLPPTVAPTEPQVLAQLPSPGSAPAQPPAPASQPPTGGGLESPFSRRGVSRGFSLTPGNPAGFKPCKKNSDKKPPNLKPGEPWIDTSSVLTDTEGYYLEQGKRAFFYACDFVYGPDPSYKAVKLTAWIDRLEEPLDVKFYLPPYESPRLGIPQGVVVWEATCDLDAEVYYTLTITNGEGKSAPFTFKLKPPTEEHIVTVPQSAPAGATFYAYFCGYTPRTTITVDLYYQAGLNVITTTLPITTPPPTPSSQSFWYAYIDSWDVPINPHGWGRLILPSSPDDRGVAYLLQDPSSEGDVFWILR